MHAMHYRIPLPTDYNMSIIRQRVADKGSALDTFPGLGLKAYLIREAGVHGSAINEYAPFYLWSDIEAMKQFLYAGIGFGGIVASFGRPPVAHYNALAAVQGTNHTDAVLWATLDTWAMTPNEDPHASASRATEQARELATTPNTHTVATTIDPTTWVLRTFTLWTAVPPESIINTTTTECFEVLHLSKPDYAQIVAAPTVPA